MCRAWTTLVDAGLLAMRGAPAAASAYGRAAEAFDALEMPLFAAGIRRRRGALVGGAEGAALVSAADALFTAQGVREPERFARALVP